MSDDLITSLRALAAARHDDLSVAVDAVIEIQKLHAENMRLRAELDKAQRHIEMLQAKLDAEKSCACAYDDPNEVCLPHSPLLEKARAENERLRVENKRVRAEMIRVSEENRRLREDIGDLRAVISQLQDDLSSRVMGSEGEQ